MPTATPFTALGRGNGFPFCVTRKTSSTNTTGSSMTFSLEKVMEIYWKYSNPTGIDTSVVETPSSPNDPISVNISSDASQSFFYGFSPSTSSSSAIQNARIKPLERVCSRNRINIKTASSGIYQYNGADYPFDLYVAIGYNSSISIIEDSDNLSNANRFGVDFGDFTSGFYEHFSDGALIQNILYKRITTYEPNPDYTYQQEGSTQITFDGITAYKWREVNGSGSGYFNMEFDDVPEITGVEKYTFT